MDGDNSCPGFFSYDFCITMIKLGLDENNTDVCLAANIYQLFQMGRRGLLSALFDADLLQSVIAGEIGKGRMINHKCPGSAGLFQGFPDNAVCLYDTLAQTVVSGQIIGFVLFIQLTERFVCITRDDEGIAGRIPDMWFHASGMAVVSVNLFFFKNEVYIFRRIEYLNVG